MSTGPSDDSPLHLLNAGSRPVPIFAFPPSIGFAWCFDPLAVALPEWRLWAFDFVPGEERGSFYANSIEQQTAGPAILLGYSAGGSLAFEVAMELERRRFAVKALIVLDRKRIGPNDLWFFSTPELEAAASENLKNPVLEKYLQDPAYKTRVLNRSVAYMHYFFSRADLGTVHVPIHLILAAESPIATNHSWGDVTTSDVTVYQGAGKHSLMFAPEFIGQNAQLVREILLSLPAERVR